MSNNQVVRKQAVPAHYRSARDEEDAYFADEVSPEITVTISMESFEKDRICACCGLWKSEHVWDTCQNPVWI